MKKQNFLLLTILLISLNCTFAQQLPNASFFMHDYTRTNPGSFGSKDMICVSGIWKTSMTDFKGAPQNYIGNASVPFNLFGAKHGAGVTFFQDEIGFYKDITLKLGYAFRFDVAEGTLGLGVSGSIRQKSLGGDGEWVFGINGRPDDPNIPEFGEDNFNSFGASVGLFYRSEDIYLGISASNAYSSVLKYEGTSTSATETIKPHYYVTAGYKFQLSNPAYEIEPAVQLYSDGVSTTFDLNGILTYNKKLWGGVSYRAGSAVVGMAGLVILDGLKVGVAYDYYTSALSQHSKGGTEILLNYCFKLGVEKSPQRYRSIRYL